MKNVKYLLLLCVVALMSACTEKDYVNIDSLQVFGERFYKGETVNMGMSVSMSNPDIAEYYWECDGGQIVHRNGYVVNQWKAPRENGVYTVRCTVKCGSASETREAKIVVDGYFFETFGNTTVSMNNSGATSKSTGGVDGYYQGVAQSGKTSVYLGKDFGDSELYAPVSGELDCWIIDDAKINTNKPLYPVDSVKAAFKNVDNPLALHLEGNTPPAEVTTTYFIKSVRVEWWPMAHLLKGQNYSTVDEPLVTKRVLRDDFDGMVSFQWTKKANADTGEKQASGWFKMPFKSDLLRYSAGVKHRMALCITNDNIIKFFCDGVEVVSYDGMAQYCAANDNAKFQVKGFRFMFPGKTACGIDNMVLYDDGTFGK